MHPHISYQQVDAQLAPPREGVVARIEIEITSRTWREVEEPIDLYDSISYELEETRIEVVPEGSADCKGVLLVNKCMV